MRMKPSRVALVLALVVAACAEQKPLVVPPPTVATVDPKMPLASDLASLKSFVATSQVKSRAGEPIDPFRHLEDAEADATKKMTDEENARFREHVSKIKGREAFRADIQKFLQVGSLGAPAVRRTSPKTLRYFHTKREGAQNQSTLYVRDGRDGKDRVLLDVSALSQDGTSALDWWFPSRDGKLLAWGRSESGSEESVLHVRDVETGRDLPLAIDRTRHASVAWKPDGSGFYYSRYPEKGTVPEGDEKYGSKIFFHDMAKDPKDDTLVFGDALAKTDVPSVQISPDGKWLLFHVHMGWDKNEVYLRSTEPGATTIAIAKGKRARFSADAREDALFVHTNDGTPKYALYEIAYADLVAGKGREAWKVLVAEGKDTLEDVAITKKEVTATYLVDAQTKIVRYGRDGKKKGDVGLPDATTATVSSGLDGDEIFVRHESYARPAKVEVLGDFGGLSPWDKVGASFSAGDIQVARMFATSKDGTKIPLFVVSKGKLPKKGDAPTVLYGYGGFNVNQLPAYSARVLSVVSRGGVWAHAILRGGGEYGEAWHQAGMLDKKQNVFDDYYACAEKLFAEKIASRDTLAAMGGSNGGLLVATAVTQRPELFRAGAALVPLTDMLRYHRFRIGKLWIPEYGDPDDPRAHEWLAAYSPYHHVVPGTRYPSMLFTTAESDSRVDPMHARKMTLRLRAAQADTTRPVLLRVETKAGHGAGKPVSKVADEMADELSFLLAELGHAP